MHSFHFGLTEGNTGDYVCVVRTTDNDFIAEFGTAQGNTKNPVCDVFQAALLATVLEAVRTCYEDYHDEIEAGLQAWKDSFDTGGSRGYRRSDLRPRSF